jgi:hypothetical protein
LLKGGISAKGAVTSDVSQGPNNLITDIGNRGSEQPDKLRDGVGVDDHLGMVGGPGGNVRQGPRGFKLKITRKNKRMRGQRQ